MATTTVSPNQLSPGATKARWSGVQAKSKGLDSESVFKDVAQAGINLQEQINQILRQVRTLAGQSGGSTPSTIGATEQEVAVPTAATTTITPAASPAVGAFLVVVLTIDATGGGQIIWKAPPAGFKGVGPDDIDNRPSLINTYLFTGRADGNWWRLSMALGLAA